MSWLGGREIGYRPAYTPGGTASGLERRWENRLTPGDAQIGCSKLMTCGCLASGAGPPVEHRAKMTATNNNLLVTSSATILDMFPWRAEVKLPQTLADD